MWTVYFGRRGYYGARDSGGRAVPAGGACQVPRQVDQGFRGRGSGEVARPRGPRAPAPGVRRARDSGRRAAGARGKGAGHRGAAAAGGAAGASWSASERRQL